MKATPKIEEPRSEIFQKGMAELHLLIKVTYTTKESLEDAQRDLENMPESQVQQMIALGMQHLKDRMDLTKVENNFRHVEEQLLRPVIEDADYLALMFGIDPIRLRLLVVLHDLGKVEIPGDLWEVLNSLFPTDFVAREILTHEYASMHWIAKLGEALNCKPKLVVSLQRLIANHNFGPDLCAPRHRHLLNNWWPGNFRTKIFPKLKELGFDLDSVYKKTPDGSHQYNHAEENVYAALLSVYDRAIATKFNTYGLTTWQKFAEQDYNAWQVQVGSSPNAPSPLKPSALTQKMEQAALWAKSEVEAMWAILAERHVKPEVRETFKLTEFAPYQKQIEGVTKLLSAIAGVKSANVAESAGRLLYRTKANELYRVDDRHLDSVAQKAKLFAWENATNSWTLIAEDRSPVKLYFEVIRGDL